MTSVEIRKVRDMMSGMVYEKIKDFPKQGFYLIHQIPNLLDEISRLQGIAEAADRMISHDELGWAVYKHGAEQASIFPGEFCPSHEWKMLKSALTTADVKGATK